MKYVQINPFPNGSTGGIMMRTHKRLLESGVESHVIWGRGRAPQDKTEHRINSIPEVCLDVLLTRIDGRIGFHSWIATRTLLRLLEKLNPDIVHLHNLHGYYVNIEMLFRWLASHESIKVIWTLHDCWALTGHCYHFISVGCNQWQTHCSLQYPCPQVRRYPKSYCSRSVRWNHDKKRELFTLLPEDRLRIVVPSLWLANFARQSYLGKYQIDVEYNTVDTAVFKPTESSIRKDLGIDDRIVVLGVAPGWAAHKGLDTFIRLCADLDPSKYAVVVVGLTKHQLKRMPDNMIGLAQTSSALDLAKLYSAADVFLHPGEEESFGMTVAEAVACGTKVIVRKGSACAEAAKGGESIEVDSGYQPILDYLLSLDR